MKETVVDCNRHVSPREPRPPTASPATLSRQKYFLKKIENISLKEFKRFPKHSLSQPELSTAKTFPKTWNLDF